MDIKLSFAFAANRDKATKITPHTHNCHELVFYGRNSKGMTVFDDKCCRFSEGGIALIKNGIFHSEEHYNAGDVVCVGFKTGYDINSIYISDMHELKGVFDQIIEEVNEQLYCYENIVSCKIEEILVKIMRKTQQRHSEIKTLAHCRQYMKENYSQNIKISDVAAIIGYSADHFRHLFKKNYGMSPQAYLIEKRLNVAYGEIVSTDQSFSEIAENNGFSNLSQFTRMIKERFGKTPTQIRNGSEREVVHML